MKNRRLFFVHAFCIFLLSLPAAAGEVAEPSVARLQHYLTLDTSNPPGNEKIAALYLKSILDEAGISSEIYEPSPGRANLYARLRGTTSAPGLLLHHHMDVVPASPAGWASPPFAAKIDFHRLVARGAVDDKSLGMAELEAFVSLHASERALVRDVVFLATADEETGGKFGVAAIRQARPEWLKGIGFALGEGGQTETVTDHQRFFGIEVTQKSALWLRLGVKGTGGHSASPAPGNSGNRLARALGRLAGWDQPLVLSPAVEQMLSIWGAVKPPSERDTYRLLPRLVKEDPARIRALLPSRILNLLSNTVAITRFGTDSAAPNILPASAWAELDCRLLPTTDSAEFRRELERRLDDPEVNVEVLLDAPGGPVSDQGALYQLLVATFKSRFPGVIVGPDVSLGVSENRLFRAAGIQAYGITPFRINIYDLAGVHGVMERIRTDWFLEGVETMKRIVRTFALSPG